MATYDMFRKIAQECEAAQIKNDLLSDFKTTPSFYTVKINGVEQDVHILSTAYTNVKKILSKPEESFNNGDIVEWNSKKWIITKVDADNLIQTKANMLECSYSLPFYKDHVLYEIPAYVESNVRLFNLDYKENKYFATPESNIIVHIPNNNITTDIKRNYIFNLAGDNYKVVDVNKVIEPGLIVLKLEWCAESPENIPEQQLSYMIDGDDIIRVGTEKPYRAIKYSEGQIDSNAKFVFQITANGVPADAYNMLVVDDTEVKIKCNKFNYTITLTATDKSDATKSVSKNIKLSNIF